MRLKINNQQIQALLFLFDSISLVPFKTAYEEQITVSVLSKFRDKLVIKSFSKKLCSIEVEPEVVYALNYILINAKPEELNPLVIAELSFILQAVNRFCLS
jgi:hypothetical protein